MLSYYLDPNIIVEVHENFERDRIDSILNSYSKNAGPVDEIIDQIEMIRNANKTPLKETIAERVKLGRQKVETLKKLRVKKTKRHRAERLKSQKNRKWNKNLNSKQTINQTIDIISTNKSQK